MQGTQGKTVWTSSYEISMTWTLPGNEEAKELVSDRAGWRQRACGPMHPMRDEPRTKKPPLSLLLYGLNARWYVHDIFHEVSPFHDFILSIANPYKVPISLLHQSTRSSVYLLLGLPISCFWRPLCQQNLLYQPLILESFFSIVLCMMFMLVYALSFYDSLLSLCVQYFS